MGYCIEHKAEKFTVSTPYMDRYKRHESYTRKCCSCCKVGGIFKLRPCSQGSVWTQLLSRTRIHEHKIIQLETYQVFCFSTWQVSFSTTLNLSGIKRYHVITLVKFHIDMTNISKLYKYIISFMENN